MTVPKTVLFWKTAPFVRLLVPFTGGIIIQWYVSLSLKWMLILLAVSILLYTALSFIKTRYFIRFKGLSGILLNSILFFSACLITWNKDLRHHKNWYGNFITDSSLLLVRINEPPVEKPKSYKVDTYVEYVINGNRMQPCKGKLLLYFSKDTGAAGLTYGDKIIINKKPQPVKNNGNPGAFNYSRYAAFQQFYHNIYLTATGWVKTGSPEPNWFNQFIFSSQQKILSVLKKNIKASKDETGVAEALLIGYKEDLDKDLVQAYSNTGVVHIIAISGLHLGLIYIMLTWLFARIPLIKRSKLIKAVLTLGCLWLFSLLTGASASVLRSAVMFTCIVLGENFVRKGNIYNSLGASAFIMLCYNPYYLWDVGFQLSYLAVIGIVLFQQPIYNWFYIKNKWLDKLWKLLAVSLAAQLLTFPVCIYYFHQFPNLFLFTNIIAVPLSSIILIAEILLIAFAWVPVAGEWLGNITTGLVYAMNKIVLWANDLPFALWDKIAATPATTFFLYGAVISICAWLLNKNKKLLWAGLCSVLIFTGLHTVNKWQVKNQQKIIVYNVPQKTAVDFISGGNYVFKGDSALLEEGLLQNFYVKPARVTLQLTKMNDSLPRLKNLGLCYQFYNRRILFLDQPVTFDSVMQKINVDIIVLSKNPKLYIPQLAKVFRCSQYVFDASNPLWKIEKWKHDCDELHLQYHSIPEQGAFILDL